MKTPREILLERHQTADPKLKRIRKEVLADALLHSSPVRHAGFLLTLNSQLSTLLWPHPRAWAALAGVWAVIFALHFASDGESKMVVAAAPTRSPEALAILQEQRRLLVELSGRAEARDADRRNLPATSPRSECREWYAV